MSSVRRRLILKFFCYYIIVSEVTTIKNAVLNLWMKSIESMDKYDEVKLVEIRYGLEGFYLTISKLIIIILLAVILDTTFYTLIFLLFSLPIRTASSGFHANTSFQCLIISILAFILVPLLANQFILPVITKSIIYFCLLIGFWIMAPKDSEKKPIVNNKKRFWLKIFSVSIIVVYFLISFFVNNTIDNLMILALIIQLIMISPIPYKLFKQKYNFKWFK